VFISVFSFFSSEGKYWELCSYDSDFSERYRDLIEAADTIGDMKQIAEGIISHIDNMSTKCQQLQQKHLLGFKLDTNNSKVERFVLSLLVKCMLITRAVESAHI
jgi:hypothetical protein